MPIDRQTDMMEVMGTLHTYADVQKYVTAYKCLEITELFMKKLRANYKFGIFLLLCGLEFLVFLCSL
jgi:hypothetical protein